MSEPSQGAPDLESRLDEVDRRLREIQAELVPGREPRPASTEVQPPRGRSGPLASLLQRASWSDPKPDPDHLAREMEALTELHGKLLAWIEELLDTYQSALARQRQAGAPPGSAPGAVTVSAGPFVSIEALCAFERTLSALPGVREVTRRGFEGVDRAIVDVELSEPKS